MDVLHVYREGDALIARYVAMLTEAVGSAAVMRTAVNAKELKRLYAEQRPDIVHLHGLPPCPLPEGIRLVFTPHGEAAPNTTHHSPLTPHRSPLTPHQAPLPTYVVVARSKMEAARLAPLYNRIETVLNPLITRTTTTEICASQMMAIYQRVMDSNVLQLMDSATREALAVMLAAAIGGDKRWIGEGYLVSGEGRIDSAKELTSTHHTPLTTHQFRHLYIYARHEGVLSIVQQGIRLLGIQAPPPEPTESYLPDSFQVPQPMDGAPIPALLTNIKEQGPSLLRLVELAQGLREDDLDESQLLRTLEDSDMQPLLASVLQLMSEQLLLTEGFMPCQPEDNSLTNELRRQLIERQDVMA